MFRFAHPQMFWLAIPLAAVAWRVWRHARGPALVFTGLRILPDPPLTWRLRLAAVSPLLFIAGLAPVLLALARPQTVLRRVTRTTDAVAIQMVVDVSGSMDALDFSTDQQQRTRLDVVKDVFADFVGKRPDDLIGLISFAGYPATRAPLTADHRALLRALETVEVPRTVIGPDGEVANPEEALTAIGDALATACARLETVDVKSRVIVLLSDGESNYGIIRPETAIQAARRLGFRVYVIGVGTTGLAPVKARDGLGREVIVRARVTLDEPLLRRIADETDGRYFNVRSPRALEEALEEVDRLEKTRISQEVFDQVEEWFPRFLIPGLALLAAAVGIHAWTGRSLI